MKRPRPARHQASTTQSCGPTIPRTGDLAPSLWRSWEFAGRSSWPGCKVPYRSRPGPKSLRRHLRSSAGLEFLVSSKSGCAEPNITGLARTCDDPRTGWGSWGRAGSVCVPDRTSCLLSVLAQESDRYGDHSPNSPTSFCCLSTSQGVVRQGEARHGGAWSGRGMG